MSSFGTKKPGGSMAVQMTFPTVFEDTYAKLGDTPRFAPTSSMRPLNLSKGDDFQASWHEQKRNDANRMANAKVQSTHLMNVRAQTAVHNMPFQPKPVLGQRKFANPSMGSQSGGNSARVDWSASPFHYSDSLGGAGMPPATANGSLVGGVLRTAVGQNYGAKVLHDRIAQLNAINEAKQVFDAQGATPFRDQFAGAEPVASLDQVPQIELAQLLQTINDSLTHNFFQATTEDATTRFTYQDTVKAFALLVRLASTGSSEEISDALEYINGTSADDGILTKLESLNDNPPASDANLNLRTVNILASLGEFWKRIKIYLEKMLKLVGSPEQERTNASKALIRTLKFSKFRSTLRPEEFIDPTDAQQAMDNRATRFPEQGGGYQDGSSSSSSGPSRPFWDFSAGDNESEAEQRFAERGSQQTGHRSRRGSFASPGLVTREDSQHGFRARNSPEFTPDERNAFAYQSGSFQTGGRPVGWEDEEFEESPEEAEQAEEGEEEAEGEAEAEAEAPDALASLASRRNEFGDYDVVTGRRPPPPTRESSEEAEASSDEEVEPLVTNRSQLPKSLEGFKEFATVVNNHYSNRLPDGKGPIRVGVGTLKAVRSNFIRRLKL